MYEMDLASVDEIIIKQNVDGDLYAIIKTNDKTKTKAEMKKYFDKLAFQYQSYEPEKMVQLEERLEKEVGNYLIFIIHKDGETIYNNVIESLE